MLLERTQMREEKDVGAQKGIKAVINEEQRQEERGWPEVKRWQEKMTNDRKVKNVANSDEDIN